ncbi:hypothetical protein FD754_001925 [Muntiacus muntjak]|uniref:Uncharacterized protein n=1 Tax=Muntiacus muntjak TaxID=9888 RepID=A0A5N3W7U4_MUNMU|nr:hypothetical protein FD754_001925 [Muntiacus muntjak]
MAKNTLANAGFEQASVSSGTSLTGPDSVNFVGDDKAQLGLPEVAESTWWFKSFFQSVPVLSNESQLLGEMADSGTVNRFWDSNAVKDKPGPFHDACKDTNAPK